MKIKIFSHCVDFGCGQEITQSQVKLLEDTGLYDAADEVFMFLHYNPNNYNWLRQHWKDKKVYFNQYDQSWQPWYEATTGYYLQEHVHTTEEDFYVCHITHKGCSHPNPGNHQNWRKYMEYWNIERWQDCVAKLDEGYDTCGASYLNNPPYPFYAGNFFWAKASYLRKCRRLKTPLENNFQPQFEGQPHHRFDWECWHGSGNPKAYDLHPGVENRWYGHPYSYRNDLFIYNTHNVYHNIKEG